MPHNVMVLDELDDRAVLRVLSHLTEQMHGGLPDVNKASISPEEARQALHDLLAKAGENVPELILPEGTGHAAVARRYLQMLLEDAESRPIAEALVANPPDDGQRSLEEATAAAIILGALITWLQTKVKIVVNRKDGKTEVHIELLKNATEGPLLSNIAKQVGRLLLS
ncbi:MAG: hypothetical protein JO189_20055 [Deltaproteobacteria bacterium]|nr:hypothetical protein [Deltaproteobacteria bacterium]